MAYVVYQKGYVVFGFGETLDAAIDNAKEYTDIRHDPVADWEGNYGDMVYREISERRLAELEESDDPADNFEWEED